MIHRVAANRRGHAVLLAQNLENPFGVYHMAPTGRLRRRRRPSTFSITYPDRKTTGVYHDHHPDAAADAALPVPVLSRQNPDHCPSFIPSFTAGAPSAGRALHHA